MPEVYLQTKNQPMGKWTRVHEGAANMLIQRMNVASASGTETPHRTQPVSGSVIESESTSGWLIALAGLFVLMLCAAGAVGVWYFFLR
jgi:hypothetical protein